MKTNSKKNRMNGLTTYLLFAAIIGVVGLLLLGGARPAAAQSFSNEVKLIAGDGAADDRFG